MDINSLLSPEPETHQSPNSFASSAGQNGQLMRPCNQSRTSSNPSQQFVPQQHSPSPTATPTPSHSQQQPVQKDHQSLLLSFGGYKARAAAASGPTRSLDYGFSISGGSSGPRPPVMSGIDTLAEAASNQSQHATLRPLKKTRPGSSNIGPQMPHRSSFDQTMLDSPKRLPPPVLHAYRASTLTDEESRQLAELARKLKQDRTDENGLVKFVGLLRLGFSRCRDTGKISRSYELLRDLRHARAFMSEVIPVGEDIWIDWLSDEHILAETLEDRLGLLELHSRAVNEEPSSTQLWYLYGDYLYLLWISANCPDGEDRLYTWSAEEKAMEQQVFTWSRMIDVWEAGIDCTKMHMNDSHVVWDRYIEILLGDLAEQQSPPKIDHVKKLFMDRLLHHAHASWDKTCQAFSSFLSVYDNQHYEEIMADVSRRSGEIKKSVALREPLESKIQQAKKRMDKTAEHNAYREYLAWELRMQGVFSYELIVDLFARATTRYHTDATLWRDYVEFLVDSNRNLSAVPHLLERATKRCPWSGELWAHRLLALESENRGFQEIESIKHNATVCLQPEKTGLEDLLKVYIAWCGYLRRRAFDVGAGEDELDVAEVGIRSALEHFHEAGERLEGKGFKGDSSYRLERIHLRLLFQRNDASSAREIWTRLIHQQRDKYDFWYRYYIWAMLIWGKHSSITGVSAGQHTPIPREATTILRQALKRLETLDSPENLINMFLHHCEQHETVEEYRKAVIEARRARKKAAERREREYAEQWAAYYAQPESADVHARLHQLAGSSKRAAEDQTEDDRTKRQKHEVDELQPIQEEPKPVFKRDREHAIVIMENLPADATELKVRQFFRDSGTINSIRFRSEAGADTQYAIIEFETAEEARFAQTRSAKPFNGREISIRLLIGTTLWVTNYPPIADEKYIRQLFKDYGEIIDVRFPSLQGNTARRFCYVQFSDRQDAHKATVLDGRVLDGHHLTVKLSDPIKREARRGALHEEREVYITNLDWSITEADLAKLFAPCNGVEAVRIPRKVNGKSKGYAFIVFKTKDHAIEAVATYNNTAFKDRTIAMELAVPKAKRVATTFQPTSKHSVLPEPEGIVSDAMALDKPDEGIFTDESGRTARARTIALLDLPDTVNSSRVEVLLRPFGSIVKLSLRPDHGGAIIEFAEEASVGRAGLGLEGTGIDGKAIRVGTASELLRCRPEVKATKLADRKKVEAKSQNGLAFGAASGLVSRPNFGRRGGLGKKTGLGFASARLEQKPERNGEHGGVVKNNADFRELFLNRPKARHEDTLDMDDKNIS